MEIYIYIYIYYLYYRRFLRVRQLYDACKQFVLVLRQVNGIIFFLPLSFGEGQI